MLAAVVRQRRAARLVWLRFMTQVNVRHIINLVQVAAAMTAKPTWWSALRTTSMWIERAFATRGPAQPILA